MFIFFSVGIKWKISGTLANTITMGCSQQDAVGGRTFFVGMVFSQ
jgi:hypothetical protein